MLCGTRTSSGKIIEMLHILYKWKGSEKKIYIHILQQNVWKWTCEVRKKFTHRAIILIANIPTIYPSSSGVYINQKTFSKVSVHTESRKNNYTMSFLHSVEKTLHEYHDWEYSCNIQVKTMTLTRYKSILHFQPHPLS